MEIDEKIDELFKVKDAAYKLQDTNSTAELKQIEKNLNEHMKNKQGLKYKKVNIVYDKSYDAEKFGEVIDHEFNTKMANKKWKGFPMFLKWKLLQEYFAENKYDDVNIAEVKTKLMNNTLLVECDGRKVTKIA